MFGKHKLHTIEPELVIDLGGPAFTIVAPSDPLIACVPRHGGDIVIYRELEKHKEFAKSVFSRSPEEMYFSHNGEYLIANQPDRASFLDLDGKLLHEMHFPQIEHYAVSTCFTPDGTFVYLGPRSEKDLEHFVIAVWPADLSMDKLGRFEFASDIQDFKIWTGAGIRVAKRNELAFVYRADGHGGESEDFHLNVIEGRISLTKAFGESCFVDGFCCAPSGTYLTLTERHPAPNRDHPGRVRRVSLPDFEELGDALHWPAVPQDCNWDNDYVADCDSISDGLAAIRTGRGRIFLVCTNEMQVIGEIQTSGYESIPCPTGNPNKMADSSLSDIRRYQDKYLLASYGGESWHPKSHKNTSLAFLPVDQVRQCCR